MRILGVVLIVLGVLAVLGIFASPPDLAGRSAANALGYMLGRCGFPLLMLAIGTVLAVRGRLR